jgi:hypothetical protein
MKIKFVFLAIIFSCFLNFIKTENFEKTEEIWKARVTQEAKEEKKDDIDKKTEINFDLNENNNSNSNFTFTCQNSTNCNKHGNCMNTTHCNCDDYYTTLENLKNLQCNYLKLSQKKAFLLSFFLGPTAVDQLYLGHFFLGLIKLLIPLTTILLSLVLFFSGKRRNSYRMMIFGKVLELAGSITIIVWWLIDWVLILRNYYKDLNKVNMFSDL